MYIVNKNNIYVNHVCSAQFCLHALPEPVLQEAEIVDVISDARCHLGSICAAPSGPAFVSAGSFSRAAACNRAYVIFDVIRNRCHIRPGRCHIRFHIRCHQKSMSYIRPMSYLMSSEIDVIYPPNVIFDFIFDVIRNRCHIRPCNVTYAPNDFHRFDWLLHVFFLILDSLHLSLQYLVGIYSAIISDCLESSSASGIFLTACDKMLPSGKVLGSLVFGAVVGAMITLLCVKMWEKKVAAARGKGGKKEPEEHDERFW